MIWVGALVVALTALLTSALQAQKFGGAAAFADMEGRIQADSDRYRAICAADGVTVAVPSPTEGGTEPQLRLRFVGAFRDGRQLANGQPRTPTLTRDCIDYARTGIVERYRVDDHGLQQSFRIPQALTGRGDLRIAMQVDGDVTAAAFASEHRAISFQRDGIDVIRYGEAQVLDRGGHHLRICTTYDGNGRLELIVPASFLDEASYPVIVDPAVGPINHPGGTTYNDTNPDVVFDRHYQDEYFVVWQRQFSASQIVLRGQRFDRLGNPTTSTMGITSTGVSTNPAAVMNQSGQTLIVYEANGRIEAVKFRHQLSQPGTPFVVSLPAAGEQDRRPTVISNHWAPDFTVAWDRTPAGSNNPQQIVVRHWRAIAGHPTAGTEQVIESVSLASGHVRNVRLPTNCGWQAAGANAHDLLHRAVWDRFYTTPVPGDYDVRTCSFRWRAGLASSLTFFMDQSPTTIASAIGTDELLPAIGSRGYANGDMNYCIAWEASGDVRACMYDQNGPTTAAFDVRATPDYQGMPAVGAGFCEFTIAYGEIPVNASFDVDVRAARVLVDGTVTVNDRPIDVGTGKFQHHIRACAGEWNGNVHGDVNSTMIAWSGQTGPVGPGLNDVRARVFEPVDALHTWYGSACSGPAGEMPYIGRERKGVPGEVMWVTATDAPPLSLAVLVCSNQLINVPIPGAPGCNLYVGMPFLASWAAPVWVTGEAKVFVQIPCSVPLPTTLAFQWGFLTPGHNGLGLIVSDDMDITWVQ